MADFGFDPRILLAGMRQGPDALETARSMGELLQQHQAQRAHAEQQQRAATLADIYRANAGNMGALPGALMSQGFGPQAHAAQEQQRQAESHAADQQKATRAQIEFSARALRGVRDQAGYDAAKQLMAKMGVSPELMSQMPAEYEQAAPHIQGFLQFSAERGFSAAQEDLMAARAENERAKAEERRTKPKTQSKPSGGAKPPTATTGTEKKTPEGRQLPPTVLAEIADYDTAEQQLEALFAKARAGSISGPGAKLNKFVTDALDLQSTDAAQFEGASAPVRQGVGTILESGKLAAGDEGKYKNMLPRYGDSAEVLNEKEAALKAYLRARKEGRLNALKAGGYVVPEGGGTTTAAKQVTGYRYNKDRTKRVPVYSDGSQGSAEAVSGR